MVLEYLESVVGFELLQYIQKSFINIRINIDSHSLIRTEQHRLNTITIVYFWIRLIGSILACSKTASYYFRTKLNRQQQKRHNIFKLINIKIENKANALLGMFFFYFILFDSTNNWISGRCKQLIITRAFSSSAANQAGHDNQNFN